MTYREKIKELHKAFVEASDKYIKAQDEFQDIQGFFEKRLMDDLEKAKREFEVTGNEMYNLLTHMRKQNIDPDSIFNV